MGSTSKMNVHDRQYFFQVEHGNSRMKECVDDRMLASCLEEVAATV